MRWESSRPYIARKGVHWVEEQKEVAYQYFAQDEASLIQNSTNKFQDNDW